VVKWSLLHAALVPCAGPAALGVGGTLEQFEAAQLLVECARFRERVVAGVEAEVYAETQHDLERVWSA